jgi:hypothetical protein
VTLALPFNPATGWHGRVVREWYRVYGHPHGVGEVPELYEDGETGLVYPSPHPAEEPCLRVLGDDVYELDASEPWFVVRRSCVYPTEGHPLGLSYEPWFQRRSR